MVGRVFPRHGRRGRPLKSIVSRHMEPRERLYAGQAAAREGRYADALREYVWFHEHALEHIPALYGVRLSFALSYWMDLAGAYPEARLKLEEIRDRKSAILVSGQGDRHLFHDVESINQSLGQEMETYRLFKKLLEKAPLNAAAWADLARGAIVNARDFALAAQYSDDPETALLRYSDTLNEDVAERRGDRKHLVRRLDAYAHIYSDRVVTTIAILDGLGKHDDAIACREWALALVDSRAMRKRVANVLAGKYDA
jgi:hypothetical protein